MKAAIYKGNRRLAIENIQTPVPDSNQVLVKVKYSAICGTDVHGVLYDAVPPGSVLGHEFCGTIAAVGSDVTKWEVGNRVVGGGGTPPSGFLNQGLRGHPRFNYRTMGFSGTRLRGYAEYTLMEEWEPVLIPDGVSDKAAALCEPCAIAVHAVRLSDLKATDSVAVIGAGPIGLLCVQVVKYFGAGVTVVSEPSSARLEAAHKSGADYVINPLEEDLEARVVNLTSGDGADVVFECAAANATLDQAFNLVRRLGQVVLVGIAWEPTPVLPVNWMAREIKLQASFSANTDDWSAALELIRTGEVRIDPLLSKADFIPLEGIQAAFEDLANPSTQLQMVVEL